MKKLVLFVLVLSSLTQACSQQVCGPRLGERWCTHVCCLSDAYGELRCRITNFRRHQMMNACAINDFAREIAPLFANKHSHELACIVEYVFTEKDQALRFAVSKALSYKDGHRLNMLWHMIFNPEIIEQPYEQDYVVVYNALSLLRKAVRENNMRLQLQLIEKLGFYFENRTIDFIAPLMQVALTKNDHFFVELMNLYLRPYESLNMLVVWDYLFNPVKTAYNLADECEAAEIKRKLELEIKKADEELKKFEKMCDTEKTSKSYDVARLIADKLMYPAVSPENIHQLHDHIDLYKEKLLEHMENPLSSDVEKKEQIKEKIMELDTDFRAKHAEEVKEEELIKSRANKQLNLIATKQSEEVEPAANASIAGDHTAVDAEHAPTGHQASMSGNVQESATPIKVTNLNESRRIADDEKESVDEPSMPITALGYDLPK